MAKQGITDFMSTLDDHRAEMQDATYVALSNAAMRVGNMLPADPPRKSHPPFDVFNISEEDSRNPEFGGALLAWLRSGAHTFERDDEGPYFDVLQVALHVDANVKVYVEMGYDTGKALYEEDTSFEPFFYCRLYSERCNGDGVITRTFIQELKVVEDMLDAAHVFVCGVFEQMQQLRTRGMCPCADMLKAPGKDVCFKCLFSRPAVTCSHPKCSKAVREGGHERPPACAGLFCSRRCLEDQLNPDT